MRLIDADALMDNAMKRYCKDCDKRKGIKSGKWRIIYEIGDAPCRACSVDDMKDKLEHAPTVDAVVLVRCKDCRFFVDHRCRAVKSISDWRGMYDYCSIGEARIDPDVRAKRDSLGVV